VLPKHGVRRYRAHLPCHRRHDLAPLSLNADQIRSFAERGVLVFDPKIPEHTLDAARADLAQRFLPDVMATRRRSRVSYQYNRIQDGWRFSEAVRAIALAPEIHECLRQIFGRTPRAFQTLNFRYGTEQPVHSDTMHFNTEPAGFMCGVWVALEDVGMDNGPLVYYPGSQLQPEISLYDLGPEVAKLMRRFKYPRGQVHSRIYGPYYEPRIRQTVERLGIAPEYGLIRRGQAILWAANLLHGGSPHRNRARTRWSQVTHFYFENCRYYTPLLERYGLFGEPVREWRHPAWIR
jgi:hypothetical protein